MKHRVLSIAGFDGSGGAGLQADIKTFSALGCYGMTVLTALPIQNTLGVKSCYEIPLSTIEEQLQVIFDDIPPHVIKIGMLFNSSVIEVVSDFLKQYAQGIPIVLDPVMVAKSGDQLLLPEAVDTLRSKLIPLVTLVTPNLPESREITGILATTKPEMETVAQQILGLGPKAVFVKGGHLKLSEACDLYADKEGTSQWLCTKKIPTTNNHGTGCTLSAAIASGLALGMDLFESCRFAKNYLTKALSAARSQRIGHGAGPVHHFYHLWPSRDKI